MGTQPDQEGRGRALFHLDDAPAYLLALWRMAASARPVLPWTALARISAMDLRGLPPVRWFECADGERLAYRSYAPGPGPQLVLIHGSACFGDQLHTLARDIAERGLVSVHTLDMRGHGLNARGGRWRDPVEDIGDFILALRRQWRAQTVIVGGHSAGGGLVWRVAGTPAGAEAAGWLLLAPYLGAGRGSVRPWFGGWVSRIHAGRLMLAITANLLGIHRFDAWPVVDFNREAVVHDPRYVQHWDVRTLAAFGPGSHHEQRPIPAHQPVLLVTGDADDCFRSEHYQSELRSIAPHARLAILPGLGHWDILTNAAALETCAGWLGETFTSSQHNITLSGSAYGKAV